MKVLGLMGSPRKKGNAALLLEEAMAGARLAGAETRTVIAADLKPAPCIACGGCERAGDCVVHDTMYEIYSDLETADALIVSTPIFFMGMPAQLKAIADRCQPFWARKYVLNKPLEKRRPGLFIAVGGTNLPHTFDAIRLEIKSLFHCLNVKYTREVLIKDLSEHGAIANHPEILAEARQAGEQLARAALFGP